MAKKEEEKTVDSSLEEASTEVTSSTDDANALEGDPNSQEKAEASDAAAKAAQNKGFSNRVLSLTHGLNLYLLGFGVLLAIAGFVTFIAMTSDNTDDGGLTLEGTELSQEAIDELLETDNNIGDVKETLTVEANAIFNGKILVKDSLDVAGTINVGGSLSLPGITVSGSSQFEEVNVSSNLGIGGDTNIDGTLTVNSNLSASGNVSVGGVLSAGTLSVDSIQFTEDLTILRHIDTGGGSPVASRGAAIGGAGTVSVSGTDTAGTVTVNTSGGSSSGSLVQITFSNGFTRTPHVQITPVGSTSATLDYYVTRTSTSMTIHTASAATSNTTFLFDYWVTE